MSDVWEAYAARFGIWPERKRHENFIMADPHEGPGMLYFYVWAIRNGDRTMVLDLGFDEKEAAQRGRKLTMRPREALAAIGIDSTTVTDVVISHMHWDHAGTMDDFPNATFHIQDREMSFVTGRLMCKHVFRRPFSIDHVTNLVQKVYQGRVKFHDGDGEIAPGVSVHWIGGHTLGCQCLRVNTKRGPVVLASDCLHVYENMETTKPFPTVISVADMVAGYDRMKKLAASVDHIIPGHDPLVMDAYYPAPDEARKGVIAVLDVMPNR